MTKTDEFIWMIKTKLENVRSDILMYLTPQDASLFLAQLFLWPLFFFIAIFIINIALSLFFGYHTDKIWIFEAWIFLPFYSFMICYFLVNTIIKSYKKGVKMANTNKWIVPVIIGSLVIIALFYWFQIRPSQIKQYCNGWAGNQSGFDKNPLYASAKSKYDILYTKCTRDKGL